MSREPEVREEVPSLKLAVSGVLCGLGVLLLGSGIVSLPDQPARLRDVVAEAMPASGVSNPVTAVLINFRGYDTLLEVAVMLTALWGVWALAGRSSEPTPVESNPLLRAVLAVLVPSLVLMAGYQLWIGASRPGGAFQAAALLAGAGVLLRLAGWWPRRCLRGLRGRVLAAAGLVVFAAVAIWGSIGEGALLQYPRESAKWWILAIEATCTVSLAVILLGLFVGGELPERDPEDRS